MFVMHIALITTGEVLVLKGQAKEITQVFENYKEFKEMYSLVVGSAVVVMSIKQCIRNQSENYLQRGTHSSRNLLIFI